MTYLQTLFSLRFDAALFVSSVTARRIEKMGLTQAVADMKPLALRIYDQTFAEVAEELTRIEPTSTWQGYWEFQQKTAQASPYEFERDAKL